MNRLNETEEKITYKAADLSHHCKVIVNYKLCQNLNPILFWLVLLGPKRGMNILPKLDIILRAFKIGCQALIIQRLHIRYLQLKLDQSRLFGNIWRSMLSQQKDKLSNQNLRKLVNLGGTRRINILGCIHRISYVFTLFALLSGQLLN